MPLPVERSQGSVSALVARFQTAADRDKEAQAREAGRGPRLSSGTASRRTSSFGVASVGDVQSTPVVKGDSESKQNGLSGAPAGTAMGQEKEAEEVLQDLKLDDEAAKKSSTRNEDQEPLVRGPSGSLDASSPAAALQKTEKSDQAATPSKPMSAPAPKEETPVSSPNVKASNGIATSSKSPGTKTSSTSPTNSRTPVKKPQPTPARAGKAVPSQTSPTTKTTPAPSQPRPTTTPTITPKATTTTTTKIPPATARPSAASTTSSRRLPAAGPSASSKSPTTPLVPAMTGPASSRPTPGSSHITHPAPLKPHLTGTPSKPTASFLAKQRTASISQSPESPEKKRQSLSLGRASGSRLSGLVGRAGSASPSASISVPKRDISTPSKAPTTTSGTSSRLLQGTAASRARAAAASPKVEVKDKPRSTPTAGAARGASTSPTTAKTPSSTPSRMPPVGKSPIGRIGLAGAREKQKTKAAQTPAVGLSPIGRQGLAEAREKATANGTDANGVGHSSKNGETTSPPSAPVVEPKVVATPDGPVDESASGTNGLEQQSHREEDVNDTTQVAEADVQKTSTHGDEMNDRSVMDAQDIPEIPTSA